MLRSREEKIRLQRIQIPLIEALSSIINQTIYVEIDPIAYPLVVWNNYTFRLAILKQVFVPWPRFASAYCPPQLTSATNGFSGPRLDGGDGFTLVNRSHCVPAGAAQVKLKQCLPIKEGV